MNKPKKKALLEKMQATLADSHFYILDYQGLTAHQTHQLRALLHEHQIQCSVLPNALLKLLFKENEKKSLLPLLKQSSMLLITPNTPNIPAKVLKDFYKIIGTSKPLLKGAFVHGEPFLGSAQLKTLEKLKSKEELLSELLTLLQSPATQLLQTLQSGAHNLMSVLAELPKPSPNAQPAVS